MGDTAVAVVNDVFASLRLRPLGSKAIEVELAHPSA
jgi:hypothetical protein